MSDSHSDALVFYGATGDLAYKKIFPSLEAMVKRGTLNVPVIGVAKSGWNIDQLRSRAHDSLLKHGGFDHAAFDKLCGLLRYVDGDYNDPATFSAIRRELGSCGRPAHYLAIPPVLFGLVVEQLGKSSCDGLLGEHSFYLWRKRPSARGPVRFASVETRESHSEPRDPIELALTTGERLQILKGHGRRNLATR